jgi:hypothetical protein
VLLNIVLLVLRVGALASLWLNRSPVALAAPAYAAPHPHSVRVRRMLLGVLAVAVLAVVGLAVGALWTLYSLSGSVTSSGL